MSSKKRVVVAKKSVKVVNANSKKLAGNIQTELIDNALGYSGEKVNELFEGKGSYAWDNGDKYIGEFNSGMRNGSCVQTFSIGDVFDGKYEKDKKSGQGRYLYANGDIFHGKYVV